MPSDTTLPTTTGTVSLWSEDKNDNAIKLFKETFPNRIEVIRGGSVAVEAISIAD